MNSITEQVVALASQARADEFSRLIKDIEYAEDYHKCIVSQLNDHIYMLEKDVGEREACIVENNILTESIHGYIKMPSERMVRVWWASFQEEADNIDGDEGLERMKRMTDRYYLKMPTIFDGLWNEYNGKEWNHINKTLT